MSAATDEVPVFVVPEHVRRRAAMRLVGCDEVARPVVRAVLRPATPSALRPSPASVPLRLTRRGVAALAAAVAVLVCALIALAWLSAPSSASSTPPAVVGNTVAVAPGDSLWSIAGRVAPDRDPRAEVAQLQRLNHLTGTDLVPGQVLRIH